MKTMKSMLVSLFVMAVAISTIAQTNYVEQEKSKAWTVSLGGVGTTAGDNILNDWVWGGELGVGRVFVLSLGNTKVKTEAGLRQSISYGTVGYDKYETVETAYGPYYTVTYADAPCSLGPYSSTVRDEYSRTVTSVDKKEGWIFRSELYWDFFVPIAGGLSLFAGPNASVNYGNIQANWTIGPEAGFRYAFKNNVFAYTRVNYDWNLSNSQDAFRVVGGVGYAF